MNASDRSRVLDQLHLRQPVRELMGPNVESRSDGHRQQAVSWARIAARLDAHQTPTPGRRLVPLLAIGVVAASAALFVRPRLERPNLAQNPAASVTTSDATVASSHTTAPTDLRLVGGAEFHSLAGAPRAAPHEQAQAAFEDGSSVTALTSDTLVEPLAMTEHEVTLRLAFGSVDVHVAKGGKRKWTIEAADLSVEVVGTHFVVSRTAESASVVVREGVVLARSEKLVDRAKRLSAGSSVEIPLALPPKVLPRASADALLQEADDARSAGDFARASASLQQLLRAYPHDARAGVAAFQLALVTQQLGASPARVVAAFETALSKARGQSLRQDCYWRLVLALEHAGSMQLAQERTTESLRDYPNGRYAAELRRRLPSRAGTSAAAPK